MNLRGWVTFFGIFLCILVIDVPEVQALSKPCRLAISTLRGLSKQGSINVPESISRYLENEISSSMQPSMEEFHRLLKANGLQVSRYNSAGIPVVESASFHQGTSAEVLGELVVHIKDRFNPQHVTNASELFEAAMHTDLVEGGAEFQTHDPRFYLSLPRDLNEGFILEMRSTETNKILAVAVPEGHEANSSRILYKAIQRLMLYRHWR